MNGTVWRFSVQSHRESAEASRSAANLELSPTNPFQRPPGGEGSAKIRLAVAISAHGRAAKTVTKPRCKKRTWLLVHVISRAGTGPPVGHCGCADFLNWVTDKGPMAWPF